MVNSLAPHVDIDDDAGVAAVLSDEIAAGIAQKVSTGELALGSWLRQGKIAEEYGTSRTPVREAIRLLAATGVVELIPNRGARIRVPSAREIKDGYRVRAELEGLAAELATRFATQDEIDRLLEAEELFESAVSEQPQDGSLELRRQRWTQANDQFHDIIIAASRNTSLGTTISWLHNSFPRNLTWTELSRDARLMRANVQQHRAVREAIEAADAQGARAAMFHHVMTSGEMVLASLPDHT